jgi:hypothetical protein
MEATVLYIFHRSHIAGSIIISYTSTNVDVSQHKFLDWSLLTDILFAFSSLRSCYRISLDPIILMIFGVNITDHKIYCLYRLYRLYTLYCIHYIIDCIHYPLCCLLFKTQLNSTGLSVPHRKHITFPLRAQQINGLWVCDDGILI